MNSTETGRSVTCSGVTMSVKGIGTGPAIGMTANAVIAGHRHHERRQHEHDPVGGLRGEVLLEHQLHAVGQRLQQTERAVHVRALAVLHQGDDAALVPDGEQGHHQQEHQREDGLDQHQPPRVGGEQGQVERGHEGRLLGLCRLPAIRTRSPAPAARCSDTDWPRCPGGHPHHAVDHVRDDPGREGQRAAVVADPRPVRDAGSRSGAPGSSGPRPAGRWPEVRLAGHRRGCRRAPAARWPAPPCGRRRVEPGWSSGASVGRPLSSVPPGGPGPGARARPARPRPRARYGPRAGVPSASASAASTRRSLMALPRRARPGRAVAALPVQEAALPFGRSATPGTPRRPAR